MSARKKYENLEQLCSQALQQESLDEELYCYLIKALAGKNKIGSALEVYENACRTLKGSSESVNCQN